MVTDLLTREEEVELAKWIEAGLYAEHLLAQGYDGVHDPVLLQEVVQTGRAAFERFVVSNRRLVAWLGRRRVATRATGGLDIEDLVSEGMLGIVRAVCKFDYALGYKFSTYATPWVRNFQQRAVMAVGCALTVTARDHELAMSVLAAEHALIEQSSRFPSESEIAQYLDITVNVVRDARKMLQPALSLDRRVFGDRPDGPRLVDRIAETSDAGPAPAHLFDVDPVALLDALSSRERTVITEVFGLVNGTPESVVEVAKTHRVSEEKVAQLVDVALTKLRKRLTRQDCAA